MQYGFLLREMLAELVTAHDVYRAVRAAVRLNEERELKLTESQLGRASRLRRSLEVFHDKGTDSPVETLPLVRARQLINELRAQVGVL